ncbi:MAG: hypothetical protein JW925_10215 [Syntrophaceae bacterium]|nr:hypothetical protein [Syntrophaceae bacterium]
MKYIFEKESILIEWAPIGILSGFSVMFLIFAFYQGTWFMTVASIIASILCALLPIVAFRYLASFEAIEVSENIISVIHKSGPANFTIPDDLGRVVIGADDLKIELKKDDRRFVLRSRFLKNKTDFHKHFNQIIKDHPPSTDKVILKASVLEIMDNAKKS